MGGSKKRKRDESVLPDENNSAENTLHTPIPNLQISLNANSDDRMLNNQNNKRKLSDEDAGEKIPKLNKRQRKKQRIKANKQRTSDQQQRYYN